MITISLNCSVTSCGNVTLQQLGELYDHLYIYDKLPNMILIGTYIPLFLIALFSNCLVIVTVSRYRSLRSVTNYFLVNLSIADLLVTLICMPMAVGQAIYSLWIYGDIMCKLTHYLKGVSVSASVFTITAMSIDRYMAIRHPMSRKIINRRTTTKIIFVIWCLALVIFSPILYVRRSEGWKFDWDSTEYLHCIEVWPDQLSQKTFGIFCFVIVYLIPGCIVVLAYSLMGLRLCSRQLLPEYEVSHGTNNAATAVDGNSRGELGQSVNSNSAWQVSAVGGRLIRERRRVAKILLVLALVFAFCWLPYSVLSLVLDMNAPEGSPPPSPDDELTADSSGSTANNPTEGEEQFNYIANLLLPFAILLGHSQAAVNPLVYCLLSKNFRRSVTDLIRHPTRVIRSRQQCKIRMTFRKDPVPSVEPNSSEKPVSTHRPRNHHAPDPTPKSSTGMLVDGGEIRMTELGGTNTNKQQSTHHLELVVAYSPTPSSLSSGYSSLRVSDNSLVTNNCHQCTTCAQYQQQQQQQQINSQTTQSGSSSSNICGNIHCGYCSPPPILCPYPHYPTFSCHCQTHASSSSMIMNKKGAICGDHRRVEVPSTIREESENSHLSQRSKTSSKVCFA